MTWISLSYKGFVCKIWQRKKQKKYADPGQRSCPMNFSSNQDKPERHSLQREVIKFMLSATFMLLVSSALLMLRLGDNASSFPRPLKAQEEQIYIQRALEGDMEARNTLIEHNLRLVMHIIKKYYTTSADAEDLVSIGTIGLIKGVSTYRPDKGVRLATYASKCIENAILSPMRFHVGQNAPLEGRKPKWRVMDHYAESIYLMAITKDGVTRYAPLCMYSFRLIAPRKIQQAQQLNRQYHNYWEINKISDRLRWCRHRLGLKQSEVANHIGISRSAYIDMENGASNYFPKEMVDKLARLLHIPVDDLLDDYSRFLYQGQGKMTTAYREKLGLGKKPFASLIGTDRRNIRAWETEKKHLSRRSWEKYYSSAI